VGLKESCCACAGGSSSLTVPTPAPPAYDSVRTLQVELVLAGLRVQDFRTGQFRRAVANVLDVDVSAVVLQLVHEGGARKAAFERGRGRRGLGLGGERRMTNSSMRVALLVSIIVPDSAAGQVELAGVLFSLKSSSFSSALADQFKIEQGASVALPLSLDLASITVTTARADTSGPTSDGCSFTDLETTVDNYDSAADESGSCNVCECANGLLACTVGPCVIGIDGVDTVKKENMKLREWTACGHS
jgi:hypothetical protein